MSTIITFIRRKAVFFNMKPSSSKQIYLYTDGACSGNPGPGGWGAILIAPQKRKRRLSGFSPYSTNNKMELTAVIQGLKCLTKTSNVHIVTDSKYIHNAFSLNWISRWQTNNWISATKEPVKNKDLWLNLIELEQRHIISWEWVKGHSGHTYNEMCDELARSAIKQKEGIDEYF